MICTQNPSDDRKCIARVAIVNGHTNRFYMRHNLHFRLKNIHNFTHYVFDSLLTKVLLLFRDALDLGAYSSYNTTAAKNRVRINEHHAKHSRPIDLKVLPDVALSGLEVCTQTICRHLYSQGGPGRAGINGLAGSKGDQGRAGLKGRKGGRGSDGGKGIKGWRGIRGLPGPQGPIGPPGDTGVDGNKGTMGPVVSNRFSYRSLSLFQIIKYFQSILITNLLEFTNNSSFSLYLQVILRRQRVVLQ